MILLEAAIAAAVIACHPATNDVVPLDLLQARVKAHAQIESGWDTLAIRDNTTDQSYRPATEADATATARYLLSLHHNIDAGFMQLNVGNWPSLGLTVERVFDGQANVCGGVAILMQAYDAEIARRVSCRYNTGHPDCSNGYPEAIARAMEAPIKASDSAPAPKATTHYVPRLTLVSRHGADIDVW